MNYTPKKAAMLLIDRFFGIGGSMPHWMDTGDMEDALSEYGWKVTEKRREAILEQVDKIMQPLKDRVVRYIENME